SDVHEQVQDCRNRALEHFLLTKGNKQHVFPSLSLPVVQYVVPAEAQCGQDTTGSDYDENNGGYENQQKCDLLNHGLKFISFLKKPIIRQRLFERGSFV